MFRLVIFSCLVLATFVDSSSRPNPSEGRIVGGHDTNISQVPHQVSVQIYGGHWCGGSIIGAKYILTAAHCAEEDLNTTFSIRAGSSNYNEGGQEIEVAKVIRHPNYVKNTSNYDAAIMVLKEPLTASEGVGIATLANVEPKVGDMVLISGWGAMQENEDFSDHLKSVSLPIVSKANCKERYKLDVNITNQMFCAGFVHGRMDTCNGDNGGPAMVDNKLAGIISWGDGCAHENSPTIFTNVASILTWISENTKDEN